jgi:hypothetical protein
LKLYASIQALRASRLPSNSQVDRLISYFQKNIAGVRTKPAPSDLSKPKEPEQPLHKDTLTFFSDVNEILEALKAEVHSKNGDEVIQSLVWEARATDPDAATQEGKQTLKEQAQNVEIPVEKDKAREDGRIGKILIISVAQAISDVVLYQPSITFALFSLCF